MASDGGIFTDTSRSERKMNTWGIVSVGSGLDNNFRGVTGYALYKTSVMTRDEDNFIVFREITGNEVEVFVNGEQKFSGDCQWGKKIEIDISDISGETELAVIIHTTRVSDKGGISRPVVITD